MSKRYRPGGGGYFDTSQDAKQAFKQLQRKASRSSGSRQNAADPGEGSSRPQAYTPGAKKAKQRVQEIERIIPLAQQSGIRPETTIQYMLARGGRGGTRQTQQQNGDDNGMIPYDVTGNMPIFKFNKLFGIKQAADRRLFSLNYPFNATNNTTSSVTVLQNGPAPCSLTAFKWQVAITTIGQAAVILAILREGLVTPPIGIVNSVNTNEFWKPETDVIMFVKHFATDAVSASTKKYKEATNKSYRLMNGDKMVIVYNANTTGVTGGAVGVWDAVIECWGMF